MKWTPAALALGIVVLAGVAAPGTAFADHHRCSNFASQAEAQAHYRTDPFGGEHTPEGHSSLDDNGDGVACEALPAPYDRMPVSRNAQAAAGRATAPPPLPHSGVGDAAESGTAAAAVAALVCCAGSALVLRLRRRSRAG
jgi:hypothetical protein